MIFEYFLIILLLFTIVLVNKPKNSVLVNKPKNSVLVNKPKNSVLVNKPKNSVLVNKTKNNQVEHFSTGNFKMCDERDCKCLKLKTAPDGTCTDKNIPKIPLVPDYKDKFFYNKSALNNIKYPKKRKYDILVFVGEHMKNKTTPFNKKIPEVLETSFKTDYSIYSNDESTMELYEIYERAIDIISYFDNKTKPYMKYLILNANNISKDRKIMKTFGIDIKKVPSIYIYNESTKELKRFLLKKFKLEKQCDILERLLIFIANGDCGFLSYLNFLHDPFYGMKYEYHGPEEKWRPNIITGSSPLPPGTGMCSLIDLDNVPEDYKCKKLQL